MLCGDKEGVYVCMYMYSWFTLLSSGNEPDVVKQLNSNFKKLYKRKRETSEQLLSLAAHHTRAIPWWEAGHNHCPGTQACMKENVNQFCFLQKEAFQYACLVSSAFSPKADFIFAFYELERGNSFPWYNMTLWRKSCPNTFCSQVLSWKMGCTEMKWKEMITVWFIGKVDW